MYRSLYLNKVKNDTNDEKQSQAVTLNQKRISDFLSNQVSKFSAEDRKLLKETFNLFEKDLEANGLRIFLEILSENPDYKFFWPQFRAIPDSSLISSTVLRKFACTYMNALKKIVECLSNGEVPYKVLKRISIKHAKHNIKMFHIQKMLKPLLGNVRKALGRQDENAEQAWQRLFQTIGALIDYFK